MTRPFSTLPHLHRIAVASLPHMDCTSAGLKVGCVQKEGPNALAAFIQSVG